MFESSAPAHHPDSSLKSTEEMEWIHDPDDDTTILPSPPVSKGTLNSFIHRSGHAVKPTEKIQETASSIPAKQSAVGPPAPIPKKALMHTRNEECDNNDSYEYDAKEEAPPLEDFTDNEEDDENKNEEAYQKMKKLGDQDHEDHKSLKKVEHSANLTMIFTFEKDCINLHTQECENGWWCEKSKCHYHIYKDCCEQWGLTMHDHAIPHNCKADVLQLLKSAYHQGHISAAAQAEFATPYDNCVDVNEEF
ncbi:hypothetical protein BDR04DRAFT_1115458 [Suillus decipiens]|nr:hypothetical protein BDR04DRAFT_1115458 [Suillus decipiens]